MEHQIELSNELKQHIDHWCQKFPSDQRRSAVPAALLQAQEDNGGWLSGQMINSIADYLGLQPIEVYEVATFYDMFEFKPVGHKIGVCTNVSCMLRGSDQLVDMLEEKLGIKMGETTADGQFTLRDVECLAACHLAPVCQVNDKTIHENVSCEKMQEILTQLESREV